VLSQLLHILLEYKIQHTMYLSSRGVISRLLRPMTTYCYATTNHSNCIRTLGCETSNQYTTLSLTNSQVGFVVKSAPPVTFHLLTFPLMQSQAFKQTFFPLHLLHCYIHPSLSERILTDESRLV